MMEELLSSAQSPCRGLLAPYERGAPRTRVHCDYVKNWSCRACSARLVLYVFAKIEERCGA